jgi:hypothetical protein
MVMTMIRVLSGISIQYPRRTSLFEESLTKLLQPVAAAHARRGAKASNIAKLPDGANAAWARNGLAFRVSSLMQITR